MKKTTFLSFICLLLLLNTAVSQSDNRLLTEMRATVYTSFFESSKGKAMQFINTLDAYIISQSETVESFSINFYTDKSNFYRLDSILSNWGYISNKDITTINNINQTDRIKLELEYQQNRKKAYNNEIKKMTEKDDRYYEYWEKIREIEKKIFELKKDLTNYKEENDYKVYLTIYDETSNLTKSSVSWVNMPGGSFDMLFIENPSAGISATQYQGYALKYMFTRGKSYATLGALKEQDAGKADSAMFEELFHFGFGQDFYTLHFGRGRNKFFNLYTGYNVGGLFATADTRKKTIFYLKAFLGVELFKNKYILIDNKVGYFVPFYYNRNLRGLTYSASFNFVF